MTSLRTIVVAWTTEEMEPDGRLYQRDLGHMPKLRPVTIPHAAVWKLRGSAEDRDRAKAWVQEAYGASGHVFEYSTRTRDPLERARKAVLPRCSACSLQHASGECDATERRRNAEIAEGIYDRGYGDLEGVEPAEGDV